MARLLSGARYLLPYSESSGAKRPVIHRTEQMAPVPEQVIHSGVGREEVLRLTR